MSSQGEKGKGREETLGTKTIDASKIKKIGIGKSVEEEGIIEGGREADISQIMSREKKTITTIHALSI